VKPQESEPAAAPGRPRLYVVALAHLDTQWRWTVRETVREFLPRTVRENEDRFRRFAHYRLNFEGAYRYRLLADCWPELLAAVRRRVGEGRWFPSGAAWEAFDSNLPAPESIVRQILYGTRELERTVGTTGRDLFLPDCFGFSRALPTLAVHCGITGFSTQKLRRGKEMRSAFGVPFPLGIWTGPDGTGLPSVLDPGEYGAQATGDLSTNPAWIERFAGLQAAGRPLRLMTYQGLGDKGGAIPAATIRWLETARAGTGPVEVVLAESEQIFRELPPEERERLPVYAGELLLRLHATGCYTSRSQLKRWHRKAEQLAHAAERASTIAHLVGVRPSERERIRQAWLRILAHEMHDDLTGTSLAEAYRYSADDLALSLNELQQELQAAVGAIAQALDAPAEGTPIAVFNALGWSRSDVVDFELPGLEPEAGNLAVFSSDDREVPSRWIRTGETWRGCFVGHFPPLSLSRFAVRTRPAAESDPPSELSAGERFLENALLRVEIDEAGDVSRILDKPSGRELLAAPIGLEIQSNRSVRFPSWEIRYEDSSRPPRARLAGPLENLEVDLGEARVAIRFERSLEGSRFTQTISLAAGAAGDHLVLDTTVDWRTDRALLKMRFPLATPSEEALFDQGVGVARRPVASPQLYEVPAQQWAALRDGSGAGAAIANDCKYGWDHPDVGTLRLTLLHTPRIGRRFRYQAKQDFGRHEIRVAIRPIRPGDAIAETVRFAERVNQPLRAFLLPERASPSAEPTDAPSPLPAAERRKSFSFLELDSEEVAVQALKLAEERIGTGEEAILRLRECSGQSRTVEIRSGLSLQSVRTVDGCERELEPAPEPATRKAAMRGFGLSALALAFDPPLPSLLSRSAVRRSLDLQWNLFAVTSRGERAKDGGLDGRGQTVPRELLPRSLARAGVELDLEHAHRAGNPSALLCSGQRFFAPPGYCRLVLLCSSFPDSVSSDFIVDGLAHPRRVAGGFSTLGRFDELERGFLGRPTGGVEPGFLREEPVALAVAHRHDGRGRVDPCRPILFFSVELAVSPAGSEIALPRGGRLVLLAAALSDSPSLAARSLAPGGLA
jgi:alpha-mannosidase